ncbi:hypothetical protein N7532_004223 [Penicillium argentinense]|uniref:Very-long-chain (3R)-3-hydroxyacyl-CoA dehydratase n=1 Tax=Penicillium argentinense TaxID=1131581 RepID=A0A9W9KEP9_9EURO|nr:uncharacterized protein N7532_004223 [Penicillium argentinense]KAJ5103694.1 hypothetical protein N7532_004223 [Penicillium argentinense]
MPPKQPRSQSAASRVYLLIYNTTCAFIWLRILFTAATSLISSPDVATFPLAYRTLEPWTRFAQTLAIAEILHAATGITRAPVFTTFTQSFARSVQVWAINYAFPKVTAPSPAYLVMLLAWSTADVVRYLYFAIMLAGSSIAEILKWSRYSLFIVLYPVGISSEWWLMYKATTVTSNMTVMGIFYFFLALYVPGSVMMYSYMLKQRRKVLTQG